MLGGRLRTVYAIACSDDEPEALRRLMAVLAAKDL